MNKEQLRYMAWDLSGLRFVWNKIRPEQDRGQAPPSTFVFWIITIYLGLFSIASAIYSNSISEYGQKISLIYAELSIQELKQFGLNKISELQKSKFPIQPKFLLPGATIKTVFFEANIDHDKNIKLKAILKYYKNKLDNSYLVSIDLSDFEGMSNSNFNNSNLKNANFHNTNLVGSTFDNAKLIGVNFSEADLSFASFYQANLENADFSNATGLDFASFDTAYSLYGAKIPTDIEAELRKEGKGSLFNKK